MFETIRNRRILDAEGFQFLDGFLADTDPTDPMSKLYITEVSLVPTGVRIDWRGGFGEVEPAEDGFQDFKRGATGEGEANHARTIAGGSGQGRS
jgi:hypothetical protein